MTADKIYLVGFMGAGKSTVARALGARLHWSVEDLDQRIERKEARAIADIFAADGEAYFRRIEREVLQEVLGPRRLVVATGGGTFVDPTNRTAINADGVSVWLDVSFDTVIRRLPSDGRRPLATERGPMRDLWEQRRDAYRSAHLHLDADHSSVQGLVERIVDWIDN